MDHHAAGLLPFLRNQKPVGRRAVFGRARLVGISLGTHPDPGPDHPQHRRHVFRAGPLKTVRRAAEARPGQHRGTGAAEEPTEQPATTCKMKTWAKEAQKG